MVFTCLVNGCGNSRRNNTEKVVFHELPACIETRQLWLRRLMKSDVGMRKTRKGIISEKGVICSKHFKKSDYYVTETGKNKLKSNSAPSIFKKTSEKCHKVVQRSELSDDDVLTNTVTNSPPSKSPPTDSFEATINEVDNQTNSSWNVKKCPRWREEDILTLTGKNWLNDIVIFRLPLAN